MKSYEQKPSNYLKQGTKNNWEHSDKKPILSAYLKPSQKKDDKKQYVETKIKISNNSEFMSSNIL